MISASPVVLACGADEAFAMPMAVTLFSAISHLTRPAEVYVIDGGAGRPHAGPAARGAGPGPRRYSRHVSYPPARRSTKGHTAPWGPEPDDLPAAATPSGPPARSDAHPVPGQRSAGTLRFRPTVGPEADGRRDRRCAGLRVTGRVRPGWIAQSAGSWGSQRTDPT